ncbi:hypothetical protein chiPu_0004511 [Chiloscyllium punctatum]|uniref:Large ribosomal subunit protein bL21m n=1 Tax=Chiloscyllium punctatum TaxID=137246 RepID=A0A401S6T6_CHIPU|nr:hypothetical protein [Chiloscyllium punctatum]
MGSFCPHPPTSGPPLSLLPRVHLPVRPLSPSARSRGDGVELRAVPRQLEPSPSRRKEAVTSLSKPPWPEVKLPDPAEEANHHIEVVQNVKTLISMGAYGRLFAVVHFASRQWKVTNEDLILIENHIEADCGDRIRLEKVLLVGGNDFTLIGRPLLGRDLVRVEATVIEKTESWPKINFRFKRRKRYRRTKRIPRQ